MRTDERPKATVLNTAYPTEQRGGIHINFYLPRTDPINNRQAFVNRVNCFDCPMRKANQWNFACSVPDYQTENLQACTKGLPSKAERLSALHFFQHRANCSKKIKLKSYVE